MTENLNFKRKISQFHTEVIIGLSEKLYLFNNKCVCFNLSPSAKKKNIIVLKNKYKNVLMKFIFQFEFYI